MAITIKELIEKREAIKASKQRKYDLDTSIGTITVNLPTTAVVNESLKLEGPGESDRYLIYNLVTAPNLKDKELQAAYGCFEPMDIVGEIFEPGEVAAISKKMLSLAGYGKEIQATLHEELKN